MLPMEREGMSKRRPPSSYSVKKPDKTPVKTIPDHTGHTSTKKSSRRVYTGAEWVRAIETSWLFFMMVYFASDSLSFFSMPTDLQIVRQGGLLISPTLWEWVFLITSIMLAVSLLRPDW